MFEQVERVAAAVKEVAAADLHALSDEELCDAAVELMAQRAALEAAHARLVGQVEARRAYQAPTVAGCTAKSAAAWLAYRTRQPKQACGSLAWLGRTQRHLPATVADAFAAGEIGADHVRRLAQVHNRRSAAAFFRDVGVLVGWARTLPFSEFTRNLDYWLLENDPDGTDEEALARKERRRVSLDQTIFGMWSGSVLLDPVSGAVVSGELQRIADELFHADRAEAARRLGREPTPGELARTPDQRRADALVEMARRSNAAAPGGGPARPLFSAVMGEDRFRELCELSTGTPIPPSALAEWAGDAAVEGFLFDGNGRCIDASRVRTFTSALRRLIEVRDRRCTDPTCDEPAHRCQTDHITPYSEGGLTSQENGRLACAYHNRLYWQQRRRRDPPPQ